MNMNEHNHTPPSFSLSDWFARYGELFHPFSHSTHIQRHRAKIIASRVGLLSLFFAITVPLWSILDYYAFQWPYWGLLVLLRLCSAVIFFSLYRLHSAFRDMQNAYLLLGGMLSIPPIFYLISQPFLVNLELSALGSVLSSIYTFLPFIVVAGLSIFPLTALETLLAGVSVLIVVIIGAAQQPAFDLASFINVTWLMFVVLGVSVFSGMSQLHYMISLINQASKDSLTGAYTRRSGEEFLDLQFRISSRTHTPLTLMFIDIDHFKEINDNHGHERGDRALKQISTQLFKCLRRSDQLIRWGGEEFVIILPNTSCEHITTVTERIREHKFGERPDGTPMTASIGICELQKDKCLDWLEMVEKADERMYKAKQSGRNKSYGPQTEQNIENFIA
ncbi:Diguanylate cyclase domain-containing protein [Candidatus Terasakiella magnetica]|uniref:diguanylate cyclase n=1 Tax=Candidatus Terasakiella magnetica TaxID=1867952 RepID=A0A1C3RKY4_9PROT|nr:sensor domain-containing diguanylate cyclase [Candidatus Terasakiella magnetica]SCA57927.1 Diguanylate cyclase domain-containing protein [Candidatus Terasakiella magnetica]